MDEGRGRVPWLDLLAQDNADTRGRVFAVEERKDRHVDSIEKFGREWADIVKV